MKYFYGLLIFLLLVAIVYALGPRASFLPFDAKPATLDIPLASIDNYVVAENAAHTNLKPENDARIVWADSVRKTPYSVVYLHGFSASEREGGPLHERFAQRYGCNLYLARLAAHGLAGEDVFKGLEPADLIKTAKEAIAIGKKLGEKVILMTTSTGSTLGLYLATEDPAIHSLVLYAPNIDLADQKSYLLNGPWGKELARTIFEGDYRQWSQDDTISAYWTTRYHLDGLHALRQLVTVTMTPETFQAVTQPVFVSYYYKNEEECDNAVSIEAIQQMVATLGSPKEMVQVVPTATAGSHPIACDLWNENWREVEAATWTFAEDVLKLEPKTIID